MTIHETKMILRKWAASCETVEQLEVLSKAIVKFFIPNLLTDIGNSQPKDYTHLYDETVTAENELLEGIEIRKKILSKPIGESERHSDPEINSIS